MNRLSFHFLKYLFLLMLFPGAILPVAAQELSCQVEINSQQIQGTDKNVFNTLAESIREYMNNTRFSSAQIAANEKIECRLLLTISEYADDHFAGNLQVTLSRPVYNTNYTTTLLNFKDNRIEFDYREGDPLVFNESNNDSNLTALLDYYAYLMLALDFDSFSPKGGDPFYERAQMVVQRQQSSGISGWKTFEDNDNRAAVLAAFTDVSTSGLRDLIYTYHRRGLDEMVVSPDKSRAAITEAVVNNLGKVYDAAPMSVGLTMFRDAKLDELVNIYSKSLPEEREKVAKLLGDLYPTESERIDKIKNPPVQK